MGVLKERGVRAYLRDLAEHWPEDLWVFVGTGGFYLMRLDPSGQRAMTKNGGVDPKYIVARFSIPCDGGDW